MINTPVKLILTALCIFVLLCLPFLTQDGRKTLPAGFLPVEKAGQHSSGWPLQIRCQKDDAVMVFVPSGTLASGLNRQQLRQLAILNLRLHGRPSSIDDANAAAKTQLCELISEMLPDAAQLEQLEKLSVDQLLARLIIYEAQSKGVDSSKLPPMEDVNSVNEALRIPVVTEVFEEEELEAIRHLKLDPVANEANSLLDFVLRPTKKKTPSFYIDKFEVTNRRYRAFISAIKDERRLPGIVNRGYDGDNLAPTGPQRTYYLWDDNERNHDDMPVTCVSEDDAVAYAVWAGKSIPTSTQWERAGVGDGGRIFPWGDDFAPNYSKSSVRGIQVETISMWDQIKSLTKDRDIGVPASVGSSAKDQSPYGCFDMAGNVSEWVRFEDEFQVCGGNADTIQIAILSPSATFGFPENLLVGFRTVLVVED